MILKQTLKTLFIVIGIIGIIIVIISFTLYIKTLPANVNIPISYRANIFEETKNNENYRKVLFTGLNSQLVIMSIPSGGEVGEEIHKYTEQTLFIQSGRGEGMLNDKKFPIVSGDVIVVVPGTKHNFWNTGTEPLKIYTVYAPPNHIDGRVHKTKADADADTADEAVGESASKR